MAAFCRLWHHDADAHLEVQGARVGAVLAQDQVEAGAAGRDEGAFEQDRREVGEAAELAVGEVAVAVDAVEDESAVEDLLLAVVVGHLLAGLQHEQFGAEAVERLSAEAGAAAGEQLVEGIGAEDEAVLAVDLVSVLSDADPDGRVEQAGAGGQAVGQAGGAAAVPPVVGAVAALVGLELVQAPVGQAEGERVLGQGGGEAGQEGGEGQGELFHGNGYFCGLAKRFPWAFLKSLAKGRPLRAKQRA